MGLFRGRKNGMTKEILRVSNGWHWSSCAGCFTRPRLKPWSTSRAWKKPTSYLTGYLLLAFGVWLVFVFLKKIFVPRLIGSNLFGSGEYYLGMFSGMIRFACMLFFAAGLAERAGLHPGGNPGPPGLRETLVWRRHLWWQLHSRSAHGAGKVFKKSFTGPYIKKYLGTLLINIAPPGPKSRWPKPAWLPSVNDPRQCALEENGFAVRARQC